jgi:predicted small secreted protein
MRKILLFAATALLFAACKNETKTAGTDAKKDSVVMPYKASYSSSFVISDSAKYEQSVLQSYKDWEDNKLANAPAYFADTVAWTFPNGKDYKMKRDSMIRYFQKYRDSLSSSKISVVAVANLHSTDKNADWVCVWYKQTDTFKTGKVDSAYYEDDNEVKKGKIAYFNSKAQKLLKK